MHILPGFYASAQVFMFENPRRVLHTVILKFPAPGRIRRPQVQLSDLGIFPCKVEGLECTSWSYCKNEERNALAISLIYFLIDFIRLTLVNKSI